MSAAVTQNRQQQWLAGEEEEEERQVGWFKVLHQIWGAIDKNSQRRGGPLLHGPRQQPLLSDEDNHFQKCRTGPRGMRGSLSAWGWSRRARDHPSICQVSGSSSEKVLKSRALGEKKGESEKEQRKREGGQKGLFFLLSLGPVSK